MLKHARETLVILEDVNILESNFAPGEILTGSRSVGSEILAKDKNRFVGHRFCSFPSLIKQNLTMKASQILYFFRASRSQESGDQEERF
jgi:hypothetical protein